MEDPNEKGKEKKLELHFTSLRFWEIKKTLEVPREGFQKEPH